MNKVSRVKNDNFTVISNVFLQDKRLSIKAKGFLAVVMGLPSDWEFTINGVCSIIKEGKTAIYNVIDELKEYGYCNVITCRDDKGRISGNDYTFYEEPQVEKQEEDYPRMENPNMDNQPQLNTYNIKDLFDKEKKEDKSSKKKSRSAFDVREDLSYVEEAFAQIWNEWLDYKDEIKKQYKTQRGARMQYNSLVKYATNNPILANAIVKTSIEHSWDGFFALSDKQVDLFLSTKSPYAIVDGNNLSITIDVGEGESKEGKMVIIDGQIYR